MTLAALTDERLIELWIECKASPVAFARRAIAEAEADKTQEPSPDNDPARHFMTAKPSPDKRKKWDWEDAKPSPASSEKNWRDVPVTAGMLCDALRLTSGDRGVFPRPFSDAIQCAAEAKTK